MKDVQQFTIAAQDVQSPLRLDKFLVQHFPQHSRATLQKWITARNVTVNGKYIAKHHFLSAQDVVEVRVPNEKTSHPITLPPIPILYEDDDVLVLEKPTGVLVHPSPTQHAGTLVDFLLEHYPALADIGEDHTRPGIVHRLDRDASGVIVVAKTPESFAALKSQFQDRRVQKEYRAIVHGVPSQPHFVITFAITHSKTHAHKMAARPTHAEGKDAGKDAWTECDVLQTRHDRYALLAIHIRTGRTHQIRAHLAAMDHPVVGDALYTSRHYQSHHEYPRLFLHALSLAFRHPTTQKLVSFTSPLPQAFSDFLAGTS